MSRINYVMDERMHLELESNRPVTDSQLITKGSIKNGNLLVLLQLEIAKKMKQNTLKIIMKRFCF